jgi:hypothetical protein
MARTAVPKSHGPFRSVAGAFAWQTRAIPGMECIKLSKCSYLRVRPLICSSLYQNDDRGDADAEVSFSTFLTTIVLSI